MATPPQSPLASPRMSGAEEERVRRTSLALWHARQDDVRALSRLLEEDTSLVTTAHDYDGRTALHVAALYDCRKVAEFLLRKGAPINALDRWGNSPLADAEGAKHTEMAKLLKNSGGHMLGNHGTRLESKLMAPPRLQKNDWEIDPNEIDNSKSFLIGKGSFGEIWKASWRGTPVAIKRIIPSLSDDKMIVQDFRHEVDLLVKLRHPNIVQFLGAVTKSKNLMLITEYLERGDLHAFLKEKGPLHASVAVKFAFDIARGMAYLHNGNNLIIHRDLKPRNILLGDGNILKVGDFGLSKLIKVKHLLEVYKLTGETGSYRYMAPEVYQHRAYDEKVDVFSFAMITYEMFEGTPPFANEDAQVAARFFARDRRPEFNAKGYPPNMKGLIQRCWNQDKAARPSFIQILEELESIKSEVPQADCPWPFSRGNNSRVTSNV